MEKSYCTPLISVIVPVYNVEAYLSRCVDSILAQTYKNLEIILVDDGSTDNCGNLCDEYAQRDPRIRVIHKTNGGLSSARNAGIDVAAGEYLGFVDSDDWISAEMYETLYSLIEKYKVSLAFGGRFDYSSRSHVETIGLCPLKEEVISGEEVVRRIFTWDQLDSAAWDKLYHRDLFADIRYPIGLIGEDVPTTYRLAMKAEKAVACPLPFYHYFHREGSISMTPVTDRDFCYVEAVMGVEKDVCSRWPQLAEYAHYLKLVTVGNTLLQIEITPDDYRKKFTAKRQEYKKIMRENMCDILFGNLFSTKQKRNYILLAFGIYRIPRMIYHMTKK